MYSIALESFIDFCDDMEIVEESLEYSVTHLGKDKKITLYHGSPNNFGVVRPNSMNVGTRLSKPRSSSFWADDEDTACMWGVTPLFIDSNIKFIQELATGTLWFLESEREKVADLFESATIYVYQVTIPTKYVGIGQDREIQEYTIDIVVTPDKVTKYAFQTYAKAIRNNDKDYTNEHGIYFVSGEEDVKSFMDHIACYDGFYEYTSTKNERKLSFLEKMIYRKDWGRRRRKMYFENKKEVI